MVPSAEASDRIRPRKRLGQHFLTDPRILESIAAAADVTPTDSVLEIGPGLGHLTRVLAVHARRVVAVELDAELAARLESELAGTPNVTIVRGDILAREPIEWMKESKARAGRTDVSRFKVVANLPYYITSAILRHLLEAPQKPSTIVVMVQREVAQRMLARPPAMNLLAVSVQFFAQVHLVRTIAPGAFYPRPKVESAVVRLDVRDKPLLEVQDTKQFFQIVHAGFGERRKQLRNSLAHGLGLRPQAAEHLLARAQIDPVRRAETLSLDEWGRLYQEWLRFPIANRAKGA
jgi:16S rRNA (adenine1518-N6/adenine1519-N6)-dimethyltransferase